MGFQAADGQTRDRLRDQAVEEHKQYWSTRNFTPTGSFATGFERGWADANAALGAGMQPDKDYRAFAKTRAPQCHVSEDDWEWVHGHGRGQEDAEKAGKQT